MSDTLHRLSTSGTFHYMTTLLLTEGDLDRGRPPDLAEHGPLRRDGSRELPPDMCLQGHQPRRWRQEWEPGRGRVFGCTVEGCPSVQYRR